MSVRRGAAAFLLAAVVAVTCASAGASRPVGESIEQLVGRRVVVAMRGMVPSADLLRRVRDGEVGGVILFGSNVERPGQVRTVTAALHEAARAGGRPPLLVMVDQEGGAIRRFRWAPPAASAAALGKRSVPSVRAAGRQAGRSLRALGVDVNLAPVADVPAVSASFIARQERAFGSDPARAASRAVAFARGLGDAGVLAVAKHFPGLGRVVRNTDLHPVTVVAPRPALDRGLVPFRRLIAADVPLVMLSNAGYAALDWEPAAWSAAVQTLLRDDLGFAGATITDALDLMARYRGETVGQVALRSAAAGVDLLLLVGSEQSSAAVYDTLVAAARDGRLPRASLEASAARIHALHARLPQP